MQRLIGLMVLLAAGIAAYFCLVNVLWQDEAVHRFVPVKAQLHSMEIRAHRGSKGGTTYSPEAHYSYEYEGRRYESTRVVPIRMNAGRDWAQGVLARIEHLPEGGLVTAYVNRRNPEESILVREYAFELHAVAMGLLAAAAVGLGMLTGVVGPGRTKMTAVALDDSGWQLLLPQRPVRQQLTRSVAWLVGGTFAVAVMPLHWFFVARQGGVPGLVFGGIATATILALAIVAFRRWSVSRHLSDARLRIRPAPMQRGESLELEVGIDAHVPLQVSGMTAHVVCVEHYRERRGRKTVYGTRTRAEKAVPLCGACSVKAGEEITGQGAVTFDKSVPPTTDLTFKDYPYFTWEIRLSVALENMVDYAAVFPLEVD